MRKIINVQRVSILCMTGVLAGTESDFNKVFGAESSLAGSEQRHVSWNRVVFTLARKEN